MSVKRERNPSHLAWLDLEMTGLDPEREVIIQAALIVTTAELEPLEEFCCDIWQPPSALEGMTPFVREMHTKTGLLKRLAKSDVDLRQAERLLLERISGWCDYPAMLCGNSIGQDKRFVERHMPGLHGYLNYRVVDVSSLKMLAGHWYGPEKAFSKPTAGAHDALVDIRNSIAELAHYRKELFVPSR